MVIYRKKDCKGKLIRFRLRTILLQVHYRLMIFIDCSLGLTNLTIAGKTLIFSFPVGTLCLMQSMLRDHRKKLQL